MKLFECPDWEAHGSVRLYRITQLHKTLKIRWILTAK